ncbi:hypothetical protein R3P38DRAFT_2815545 [Favolaschia claudopus]|uniref:Uncharacterized protein n=1 Tax=Favolaschia claudopus TaxID=2862362 RepID=A0AAV9Z170_9AGAR
MTKRAEGEVTEALGSDAGGRIRVAAFQEVVTWREREKGRMSSFGIRGVIHCICCHPLLPPQAPTIAPAHARLPPPHPRHPHRRQGCVKLLPLHLGHPAVEFARDGFTGGGGGWREGQDDCAGGKAGVDVAFADCAGLNGRRRDGEDSAGAFPVATCDERRRRPFHQRDLRAAKSMREDTGGRKR